MTELEAWKMAHGYCIGSSVSHTLGSQDVVFDCPIHKIHYTLKTPYPFCRTPEQCAGVGYCRKEMACDD